MSKLDAKIAAQARYWQHREEANLKSNLKQEEAYEKELQRIYKDMLDACQKDIDSFYSHYADKEGITIADAKKRVKKADIAEYERKAERYVKAAQADMKVFGRDYKDSPGASYYFSDTANEEMSLYNLMMKVNRLEMLKANIGLNLVKGHAEMETFMEDILQGRTEQELERQAGILGKTVRNNAKLAHSIVNASFHNATFSQRIWANQSQMKADLSKLLESGLIQGKGARGLAKDLRKYFIGEPNLKNGKKGAVYASERLMRTELARVQIDAQERILKENGFEQFIFIVNSGCCAMCKQIASKNGGVYNLKDLQIGLNAPPIHPFCRCSIAAYEDNKEYDDWLTYLENGGTTEQWNKMSKDEKAAAILGAAAAPTLTRKELQKKIREAESRIRDIEYEVGEIDQKIEKHKTKDYDDLKGVSKDSLLDEYKKIDARLAELEPIMDRWFNKPEKGTPEYDEWRAWKKTVNGLELYDEQIRLSTDRVNVMDKIRRLDKYDEWLKWKKDNPLKDLKAKKKSLANETKKLQNKIADYQNQYAAWDEIISIVRENLEATDIEYKEVEKHKKKMTDTELVERVGGGDKTTGSCASLSFAWAGNKGGMNVLDFRGGKSCDFFSRTGNIDRIAQLKGVKSVIEKVPNEVKGTMRMLKDLEPNKQYILSVGRHAAVVRLKDNQLEYLELQSGVPGRNGFHELNESVLKKRFAATQSRSFMGSKIKTGVTIIDIESLANNREFHKILGYLNTAEEKQKKGASGREK